MSTVLHIGLELTKATGGTSKAVSDFVSAFDRNIVWAFSSTSHVPESQVYDKSWHYLPASWGPLSKQYLYVDSGLIEEKCKLLPKIDAVFSHVLFRHNSYVALEVARRYRCPLFVVPHGSLDPWVMSYRALQKKIWMRFVGRRLLNEADAFIYASEVERTRAEMIAGVHGAKVIGWPVGIPDGAGRQELRRAIRRDLAIREDARVLLSFGRLHKSKCVLEAIRAASEVDDGQMHMIVVGPEDGVTMHHCLEAGERLGNRLHVVGAAYGEEKWRYIYASDCYISLSLKENFNYTLVESMACGLPVIVSPGNALGSDLVGVDCGWILGSFEIRSAAASVRAFLSTGESELAAMGQAAAQFSKERYSPERFRESLRALIKKNK